MRQEVNSVYPKVKSGSHVAFCKTTD